MRSGFWYRTALVGFCCSFATAQHPQAQDFLNRALHFADLYNWGDAGPAFEEAERLFNEAGDQRNALYAKLGRIRANVESDQHGLPTVVAALAEELDDEPLLQNDKELRMFCLRVKGDLDLEVNAGAMKQDWVQVQKLAQDLGNVKWQYRALAQLGIAAFYDADLQTARIDAGTALAEATKAGDAGAQIRILTILASGLSESKLYEQALAFVEQAIKIASETPDTGDQFATQELRINVLVALKQFDAAERVDREFLVRARDSNRLLHQATLYGLAAEIAEARKDRQAAQAAFGEAIRLSDRAGLNRLLVGLYDEASESYRTGGDLENAARFAELSSASAQASGDLWHLPAHLQILAELQIARGRYQEADEVYERAEAFIDSMIGHASTVLEQTAIVTASSQIYAQHFALIADRFSDPKRAYSVIEQVRGRVATDLLEAGLSTPPGAKVIERTVSELRLKLMAARSTHEVADLRDKIFLEEQARWVTPGASVLQTNARQTVAIEDVQKSLPISAALLEYVMADRDAYCLTISHKGIQIVRLGNRKEIEAMVASYVGTVKAKLPAVRESRKLYDALLKPLGEAAQKDTLIIVPDGQLLLVPFDALTDSTGRYIVQSQTVIYSPSANNFYLLREQKRLQPASKGLLAVGGVPYAASSMNRSVLTKGFNRAGFVDLPASEDEVRVAQAAFRGQKVDVLWGASATEAAFKGASSKAHAVIHLAVHAFADSTFPDRAALVLLSDRAAGEDGFLQASEIAQMHLPTELVVLSACETAVGPLQGQDGIANLSRAFLMAGARSVISTLWEVDDSSSLFLMKRFYAHLAMNQSAPTALAAAKRDMLATLGSKALPYQWAGFMIEGTDGGRRSSTGSVN